MSYCLFMCTVTAEVKFIFALIAMPIAVLLIASLLARFAIAHKMTMLLGGLALLLFGCWIYAKNESIPSSVCNAISAFFPSRGDFGEVVCCGSIGQSAAGLWYWLFHVGVLVYVISLLLAFFGIGLVNRLCVNGRRYILRFFGCRSNVFWGYCDEARCLAKTISNKRSIVFALYGAKKSWLKLQDEEPVHVLAKEGWKWIYDDPAGSSLLFADRHFFLGSNGHENVAAAEEMLEAIDRKRIKQSCRIYVRIGAKADDDLLYKWADAWNDKLASNGVEIVVVREEALVSRKFLECHPMLDCPGILIDAEHPFVKGEFRVLVLGFGGQGERLMNDMICDAQYLMNENGDRIPFAVDVVDCNDASFGWYKENCKTACSRFSVNFMTFDVKTEAFWQWLQNQKMYNRIIACTRDDKLNIRVSTEIAKYYKINFHEAWAGYARQESKEHSFIYARVRNKDVHRYVKSTSKTRSIDFLPFGCMTEVYSCDTMFSDKWDKGAIWLAGVYATPKGEVTNWSLARRAWNKTTTFNRESSRASVFFQRNLLRLIGCKIPIDDTVTDGIDANAVKRIAAKHMKVFAEDEHLRWMAFHYVRGIECWRTSEKELMAIARYRLQDFKGEPEEEKSKKTIVSPNLLLKSEDSAMQRNLHADLVEFNELQAVDKLFNDVNKSFGFKHNSNQQDKDYDLTLGLESILEAGFTIINDKRRFNDQLFSATP